MPHYGILREYRFEDVDDVRGAEVYGVNDEKLGTIDDVIFDHSTGDIRYIVLKTGGLLSRRKVMVAAGRIEPYGHHEDKFYAELDQERLEMLPEFHDETLKSEGAWSHYEKAYERRWNDSDVMHNRVTGRILTPPPEQVQEPGVPPLTEEAKESLNRDFTPQKMGKEDDYLGVASGTGKTTLQPRKASIAGREDVPQREVMSPIGSEIEIPNEKPAASIPEAMREPGVYKLERTPEAEKKSDRQDAVQARSGQRWIGFQEKLRERRDKVVSGCSLCGTQDKAA